MDVHLRESEHGAAALPTLYDELGGMEGFEELVRKFYAGVQTDEVLWPMYPQDDLEGAIWRLSRFLAQYFGGPGTYSAMRGHPRLRMRHAAFHINPDARDRWLTHMRAAIAQMPYAPMPRAALEEYVDRAAHALVNTFEPAPPASPAP